MLSAWLCASIALGAAPGSEKTLTLVAGGDVTLGYHYEEHVDGLIGKGVAAQTAFGWGFQQLKPVVASADLFVVNLECPFTAGGEKIPKNFNFRARPELIAGLLFGGVGAVSLANNHLMDYGPTGLTGTLDALDAAKIPHFGAGTRLERARRPAVVERAGVRIAFLGYLFLGDHSIEPAEILAAADHPGVAGDFRDEAAVERMVREDVQAARAAARVVIPFFHWGREGQHTPEPYQVQLAHAAIDAGAAAVLGSHPHVLQGVELYRGAPILYSLGNLVFGGNWDPKPKETALWRARFSPAGYVSSELIPVQTDRYPEVPLQPFPLSGEPAKAVLDHLAEYSRGFSQTLPALRAKER